jgi:hypothetical protein
MNLDSYLYHGELALALPSRELPADGAFQRRGMRFAKQDVASTVFFLFFEGHLLRVHFQKEKKKVGRRYAAFRIRI